MLQKYYTILSKLKDLPLLIIRLVLAYGFLNPALTKLKDLHSVAEWYKTLHIPYPVFNAYLSTGTEIAGFILLVLGLFTRMISIPLMITMIVAIVTVHWENGFEAGENGFEIPLYYMIMLFTLMVFGAGKLSLDKLLRFDKNIKS
jgi:putative oxidoreductase